MNYKPKDPPDTGRRERKNEERNKGEEKKDGRGQQKKQKTGG